jgi:hypothetical protein
MVYWRRWTREIDDDDDDLHFDFASLHSAALGSDSTCTLGLDRAWHVFYDKVIDYV